LLCTNSGLEQDLARTVLCRAGVERYTARHYEEARRLALAARPELVLVDRDLPKAIDLIAGLRADDNTRALSIGIVASGDFEPQEVALLEAGANAILRMPVTDEWDRRLVALMSVPIRREARFPVHIRVEPLRPGPREEGVGLALNLSTHGMLIEATVPIHVHDRLSFGFRFRENDEKVSGFARVVRQAGPSLYGLEFERLDYAGAARIQHFVGTLPA
jgi:DNA-binding response OmpR family regulator